MTEREAVQPDQSLKLARVFIEASKSSYLILFLFFSSTRHPKNLKTSGAWTLSTDLILYACQKPIFFW
jgi:hypothetical protein